MSDAKQAPDGTAAALIDSALDLFGRQGFAATSTRQIATAAGANIASIAYHFGGKEGLRQACGAEVARRLGAVLGAASPAGPVPASVAQDAMETVLRQMVRFVVASRDAETLIPFMLREIGDGGGVLDTVYGTMIEPMHRRFCALWAAATGQEAESEQTRLIVFSLIGQVLYFRIGRPIVTRRMGWDGVGPEEADRIADVLIANLHSTIERERQR